MEQATPSHIVAIGASAGGLYALECFFEAMPVESGMAFVVIQHLSPDFKSLMDDILARRTAMRIRRVENRMPVEPDTIYLIPPRSQMTIKGGVLYLRDRLPQPHFELPIDIFLQSLALDAGSRAVAIILSGTGSDGSRGIRAIHEQGGLVLVQSLESAQFDGMPRSALATGLTDYETTPERMPELLAEYLDKPELLRRTPVRKEASPHDLDTDFLTIYALLRQRYNLDFSKYKQTTVRRRLQRRLEQCGLQSLEEYAAFLAAEPAEQDRLYRDLLIGVTEWFRDPEMFLTLEEQVLPQLIADCNVRQELRVWSAGCASGEEAYSLAISCLDTVERLSGSCRVTVFATDIHRDSLDHAAAGVYDSAALANIGPDRLQRYFKQEADGRYRVSPFLRKSVVFAPHNLTTDAPFTKLDLICCRNVLIYLQPLEQERILSFFHFGLRQGGFLFLGSSENPGGFEAEFEPFDSRSKLFRKLRDLRLDSEMMGRSSTHGLGSLSIQPVLTKTTPVNRQLLGDYDHILNLYAPPGLLLDEQQRVLHYFGDVQGFLKPPVGRSERDELQLASNRLHIAAGTALQRATKLQEPVVVKNIRINHLEGDQLVTLTVHPIRAERTAPLHYYLVFEACRSTHAATETADVNEQEFEPESQYRQYIKELETELQTSGETLQATVEELQTSNEELQATNEELLASNEELQSTNEELQSVNEELFTVNSEFERKNIELRNLNLDHESLLAGLDTGVIFLDEQLRIRKFNPAIQQSFRMLPQDIGRPIEHITYLLGDQIELLNDLRQVLQGQGPVEREKQLADGRWLLYRIVPYCENNDRSAGLLMTLTDVTELKTVVQQVRALNEQLEQKVQDRTARLQQATEEAELANRSKSQFLATMSHELRTPLNSLVGYLQLLETTSLDDEQLEYLKMMQLASRNQLAVIGDVLDVARIEAGRVELETAPFQLRHMLDQLERLIRPLAQAKGLQFCVQTGPELTDLRLLGDEDRIKQILLNLLGNAVKFTDQGSISLQVQTTGVTATEQRLQFVVSDTGCGIPEQLHQRIFEPFTQVDGSITRRFSGSGLGLSIARTLAELMGGRLTMQETSSEGSSFVLELLLPLALQTEEPSRITELALHKVPALLVMVADDDEMARRLLCKLLEKDGHRTVAARSGGQVLALLQQGTVPDLLVLDLEMPGGDGITTVSAIRSSEQWCRLPVIGLSARAFHADREQALTAGMNHYLTKPLQFDDLRRLISRLTTN